MWADLRRFSRSSQGAEPADGDKAVTCVGDVYFDECIAGTKNHALLFGGDGDLITMVDSSNKKISIPTRETDELIKIQFTG